MQTIISGRLLTADAGALRMVEIIQSIYEHYHGPFRFCPICGHALERSTPKENEPPRLVCGSCGFIFYQDPKLVVCSILQEAGRIALLKRAIEPEKGKWVMPGGYMDRGETAEGAAMRETFEECGLETRIDTLFGLYSYERNPNVVVVFLASPVGGKLLAGDETREARWFTEMEIPWDDLAFQSTTDALRDFVRRCGKR